MNSPIRPLSTLPCPESMDTDPYSGSAPPPPTIPPPAKTGFERSFAVDALASIASRLGPDEVTVLTLIAMRLERGQEQYGRLDIDSDPRDFAKEAMEEAADMAVYLTLQTMRGAK